MKLSRQIEEDDKNEKGNQEIYLYTTVRLNVIGGMRK